ncbi:hypothetical protein AAIH20_37275, partial [Pseudomonas aeruginosa]
ADGKLTHPAEEFAPLALAVAPKPKDKECSCATIPVHTTPVAVREIPLLAGCHPARREILRRKALPESIPAPPVGEVLAEHDHIDQGHRIRS